MSQVESGERPSQVPPYLINWREFYQKAEMGKSWQRDTVLKLDFVSAYSGAPLPGPVTSLLAPQWVAHALPFQYLNGLALQARGGGRILGAGCGQEVAQ
jgi:hypothetical protein